MGVMLNDVSVMVLTHLEEEVTRTKASSKKTAKRGQWLGIRSPFDDDVSSPNFLVQPKKKLMLDLVVTREMALSSLCIT